MIRAAVAASLGAMLWAGSPVFAGVEPCPCPGDCDFDCQLGDDELATAILALFDGAELKRCVSADVDADEMVSAADLVALAAARVDPPAGCWRRLPPLPGGPRQEVGVAALGSVIYVLGGFAPAGTERVEAFDVGSGEWIATAPLPLALQHVGAAALGGFVYSIGGFVGNTFAPTDRVFRYDPGADRWDGMRPLPAARGGGAAAVLDGRIHFVGGSGRFGTAGDHYVYDPALDSWSELEPLPVARNHLAAATVDGVLYVVGGRSPLSARLERYQPGSGWTSLRAMPTARAGHAAAAVDGLLVVLGGEGNPARPDGVFPQVEVYDPTANEWTARSDMAVPRHGIGAVAVGPLLYVPGGAVEQGFGPVAYVDAVGIRALAE
jgi:N-acetylneuraminic acid mutarotase